MINVNVTVRFIGRATTTVNAGDLLSVNDVQGGTPCVTPNTQGVCFASNDASANREVMCLGFGYSEHSTASAIQRPLTLNHSEQVNDILPLINVSDINAPISTSTYTFTGTVEAGQHLTFTESPLRLSAGVWVVLFLLNDNNTEEQSADIHINGVCALHTPEASSQGFMKATAILIESEGGAEVSLISHHTTTYQNARCIVHQIGGS